MLSSPRVRWYSASILTAVVGAVITVVVYRRTGVGYPFIAGWTMLLVLLGGAGPSLVAGWGTMALACLINQGPSIFVSTRADLVRAGASTIMIAGASFLAELWRRSRMAAEEREARVREGASSLQELLDGLTDGVLLTDAEFRATYANAQLLEILGMSRDQLIGRSWEQLRSMADINGAPLELSSLAERESVLVERVVHRLDGSSTIVEASIRMLPGGRVLASVRDISERRRAQERQQAERNLLDGILATSVAGVLVVDLDGEITFANRRAEEVLELTRTEHGTQRYAKPEWETASLDGTPWTTEQRPSSRVKATNAPVFDVRHAIDFPDGRRLVLSVNAAPLNAEDGSIRAIVVVVSDITEAITAAQAIQERDAQLARITEAIPGMVYQYWLDSSGYERFLYASRYSMTLLEQPPEAIVADASLGWSLMHPEDVPEVRRTVAISFSTLEPWMHEFRMRDPRSPEHWRWISARAIPERVEGMDAVVWAGIMLDVTERKQLEDELRQAQKMESVGRLAGGIAHDFNNLLTAILGHAELLALDAPSTGDFAESIEQIRAAAESGSALTRQLLGFARKQVVAPQLVEVNASVRRLPSLMRRLLSDNVAIDVTLDEAVGHVRIDPAQLDQVLMNLAVNSMDAMPSGGQLQLTTSRIDASARTGELAAAAPGSLVQILVTDSGHGMSDDVRRRAFEPFFTTKAQGKGTGLGLATSYGIISQAGGVILIDSTVGRGTTVRLCLPEAMDPVPPAPSEAMPLGRAALGGSAHEGRETVLVVDDDERVRQITAESLRRFGYVVLTAESGAAAIDLSRGEPGRIDLLVTDVVMPGMSGRELADVLQRERPAIRVLFVSGYTGGAIEHHGVIEAGLSFLQKPYDRAELARHVRALLDAASPL